MNRSIIVTALLLSLLPKIALAHDGAHSLLFTEGFFYGFLHPMQGFDHLLAMICVGILSSQLGGKAIWQVPALFVAILALGGVLGILGVTLPLVEWVIALSVVALGLAIVAEKQLPLAVTLLLVGFFALFHGHAHGEEIPALAQPLQYTIGFMGASTLMHLAGVLIGEWMTRSQQRAFMLRLGGLGVLTAGVVLIIGF